MPRPAIVAISRRRTVLPPESCRCIVADPSYLDPACTARPDQRHQSSTCPRQQNQPAAETANRIGPGRPIAAAILDRLLHDAEVLAINGPSYRLKDRLDDLKRPPSRAVEGT